MMKATVIGTGRLPFPLKLGWGIGAFGTAGMIQLVNVFLLYFLVTYLGVSPAVAGLLLFLTRLYDMICDPLVGALSDRTESRWGRRRPWMIAGAVISGIGCILVFNVPQFAADSLTHAYLLIVLVAFFTGYTFFYVPAMAMPAEMTNGYDERTSIMSFRICFSFVGGLVVTAAFPALIAYLGGDRAAYAHSAILVGELVAVAMVIAFFATKNAPLTLATKSPYTLYQWGRSLLRNRPFLVLAATKFILLSTIALAGASTLFFFSYIMKRGEDLQAVFGLVLNVAGILSTFAWPRIAAGKDKKLVLIVCSIATALVNLTWFFAGPNESMIIFSVRAAALGILFGGSLLFSFSMFPDAVEYDRLQTGLNREGLYSGVLGFIEKSAFAIAPLFIGLYFDAAGLVESTSGAVAQPESAITAIVWAQSALPAIAGVIGALLILAYNLNRSSLDTMRANRSAAVQ